ncbi:MAG: hypothetical protein KAW89_10060, partial [Armatimonadetes bacterium]|nr:hypothetical protein [Armatimonadota bacterium]
EGPYVVDIVNEQLLNPNGTLAIDIATSIPAGTVIEEAELDITALAGVSSANPTALVSVSLHGTYRDSAGDVVYDFWLHASPEMELEFDDDDSGGIVVGDQTFLALIFGVNDWFTGVDLTPISQGGPVDATLTDGQGNVLFDNINNTATRDAIVTNLLNGLVFAQDDDGDGEPDDDF